MTLYLILFKKYPFTGTTYPELYNNIQNKEPKYPDMMNPYLYELFLGMFKKDPDERFDIDQIKKNEWVTKNGVEPMSIRTDTEIPLSIIS